MHGGPDPFRKIYSKSSYLKLVSGSICETVCYKGNSLGEFSQKLFLACGLPSPGQTSRFFKQREYGDPVPVCHSDQDADDRQMIFFYYKTTKPKSLDSQYHSARLGISSSQ